MNTLFADTVTSVALWIVIKASILVGACALVQFVLRHRASAATRHRIWMLCLALTLVLPLISALLPKWPLVIHVAPRPVAITSIETPADVPIVSESPAPSVIAFQSVTPAAPAFTLSWSVVLASVYWIVAGALLVLVTLQRWSLRRVGRVATDVREPDWTRLLDGCAVTLRVSRPVRLLRSRERNVPMAFGTRRPAIVIPAMADMWADDRRRAVLLHELAHVARYDYLTQTVAAVACALYWFHPAVWWVARRARIERELACDDQVIAAGTEAREYAGHLLEIAYSLTGRRAPALAVCMARPKQLEGRMLAALDEKRNRQAPSTPMRVGLTTTSLVMLVALSGVTLTLDAAPPAQTGWLVTTDTSNPSLGAPAPEKPQQVDRLSSRQLKPWLDRTPPVDLKPLFDSPKVTGTLRRAVESVAASLQENTPGTWEIRPSETNGMVHLRIVELHSSTGTDVPIQQLEGLTGLQLTGAGGPVQFKVRRDAGTFTFEGVMRNGIGAGTFSFTPDPNFPAELAKRGFARPTSLEQYQLARHDVGFAFIDELNRQGYTKPQTADLVRAGQHGVQAAYLRDMGALGYQLGTLDPLITLRDHGVTPDYVRQMAELGYKGLPADEIQKARDHGITAEYVRAMREGGYGSLSLAEITKARDHGISPEYIRGMRDAGYGSLPLTELINVRDHGITPEFVRELASAGYSKLPLDMVLRLRDHGVTPEYVRGMKALGYSMAPDELVRARDHGVTVEYVREMASLGYEKQTIDALTRVRDHGVTPEYARELKALGYDKLSLEDLTTLRDHGLTAERIRSANSRAGTKLPLDLLKSFAAGGMR
jgi:beta-lactamase regulating signal transducer with metallopeptidase domain